jgi:restriction endonuclease Mrr
VTSDIVGRFERALNASQAHQGLIVTTSLFTEAARERARGLPVALYDREDLGVWIEDVWGKAQQH